MALYVVRFEKASLNGPAVVEWKRAFGFSLLQAGVNSIALRFDTNLFESRVSRLCLVLGCAEDGRESGAGGEREIEKPHFFVAPNRAVSCSFSLPPVESLCLEEMVEEEKRIWSAHDE